MAKTTGSANGEFYIQLVRNPEFAKRAGTLVLECGNSLYQPILDRYENGEDVPFDQMAQVWRNTTKVLSWESPIYANFIAAVRDVHHSLPAAQRIRVLAADSPIDWSLVRDGDNYEKAFGGDKFFASVIEREVLAKNRKALVTELQRRHLIEVGCPLNLETWKRMSRPCS